jgi:5-hydroxyisourate hydrolase-like protein (transthyretin family)
MKLTSLRARVTVAAGVCAFTSVLASGQSMVRAPQPDMRQTGTAAISGVVVDSESGRPLPGVVVHLGRTPRGAVGRQNRQITDSRGRFVFVDLPAGEGFSLGGSKPGYLPIQAVSSGGSAVMTLSDGQWISNARLVMRKAAVIEGVVTDEHGEPVAGVEVRTIALIRIAGRSQLASGSATTTDDRGRYRFSGLLPGRYLVAVPSLQASVSAAATVASVNGMTDAQFATQSASRARSITVPILDADDGMRIALGRHPVPPPPDADGQRFTYPLTFHPGTPVLEQAIDIDAATGAERTAVDIQLRPLPAGHFRGRVEGPGQIANLLVRLLTNADLGLGFETATARTHVDGTFAFANVPAGDYVIDVPIALTEYQYLAAGGIGDLLSRRPPGIGSFNSRSNQVRGGLPGTSVVSYSSGGTSFVGGTLSTTQDNSEAMWARENVSVRAGATPDIVVPLRGSASITGRVVFEGDLSGAAPNVNLVADPATGSAALGQPSGSVDRNDPAFPFVITGVAPGTYFLRQGFTNQWTIKSVDYDGREYLETAIDLSGGQSLTGVVVTVSRASATITGAVVAANGATPSDAHVAVFPVDRAAWRDFGLQPTRLASASVSSTGAFRFTGLPAGEYYVTAVRESELDTWRSEDIMTQLAATADRVTVDWGQAASVTVGEAR